MSGYERSQTKEIITCGVVGWRRKVERRERKGRGFYRLAKSTLAQRNSKKLTERVTWFRKKRKRKDEEEDEMPRMKKNDATKKDPGTKNEVEVKAVMLVPFTTWGKLAKSLRDAEEKLGSLTGYRLKMVEKAGDKLEDILTKSNPWQVLDCGREGCLLCITKLKTEKHQSQDCHTRTLVYETWCISCMKKDKAETEERWEEMQQRSMKKRERSGSICIVYWGNQ
jgi:hypothetical protein